MNTMISSECCLFLGPVHLGLWLIVFGAHDYIYASRYRQV